MATISTIPDDAALPQGKIITNKPAMKEIFQQRLPGFAEGWLQIDALELLRFHYKPGKKCEVCYALQVKEVETGRAGSQIFSGVIEPNGAAEMKYAKVQHENHFQPEFGPAIHFLPDLHMILWGFPNDVRLKQLPLLLDHNARLEIFRKHRSAFRLRPEIEFAEAATKLVKYAPADRCTLRHDVQLTNGNTLVIYSKTFSHKTNGERIFKTMQALWNALGYANAVMIPEPLFFMPEMNTLFVAGVEGQNLDEHLAEIDLDQMAVATGAGLARIHQCRIEGLSGYSDQEVLSGVVEVEQTLNTFDGHYKPAIAAVVAALREKYFSLTPMAPVPIHGAFRLSQLLLVDGKLALIDFDDFRLGNPIADAASFVAHLLYLPLREKLTPEQGRSAIRHFCRAYAAAAPWGLPADALAWQTAAHLIGHQIKKCITLAKKDHPMKVACLIDYANAILTDQDQLM